MEIIVNRVHDNPLIVIEKYYNPNELVLFDIETTGFAAETTKLYLIGCCYFEKGCWFIKQWFNDDGESEALIIKDFMEFIDGYKYIFHYNGDGFDIPYIEKKLSSIKLDASFSKHESVDIYKQIRPFKEVFHLDNLKQKSIEKFLNINRLDKYSGGDLIKIYTDYLKHNSTSHKKLLIQHNYEDIEGLLYCCSIFAYSKLKAGCLLVRKMSVKKERLIFELELPNSVPRRITHSSNDIIITAYKNEGSISVPIIDEELKFFFDNYRDYYYLPAEDMAVHKDVATYVDKSFRMQARKDTCYIKHKGYYITQLDGKIIEGYKRSYNDKESFIELVDSFLQDIDLLNAYARYIIGNI